MNTLMNKIVGVLAVVGVLLGGLALSSTPSSPVSEKGSVGGNFNPVIVDFAQGISVRGAKVIDTFGSYIGPTGGNVTTIATTSTTYALSASDFDLENSIEVTPGGASLTLSFPSTSTLTSFLPVAGQTRTIFVRNATTTAGVPITLAGGAGVFIKSASTTAIIASSAASSTGARIDFIRRSNTDISALVTLFNN